MRFFSKMVQIFFITQQDKMYISTEKEKNVDRLLSKYKDGGFIKINKNLYLPCDLIKRIEIDRGFNGV